MADLPADKRLEFERLKAFIAVGMEFCFGGRDLPSEIRAVIPTKESMSSDLESAPISKVLNGYRDAANDLVTMIRFRQEAQPDLSLAIVDEFFSSRGAPTYSQMRLKVWQTLGRVMRRGRVKTEVEFRVLSEMVSDVENSKLSKLDRRRIEEILAEYEPQEI